MAKRRQRKSAAPKNRRWHAVPLKSSFMVLAILGFLISAYLVYPQSASYGLIFMVIFGAMLIASIVSMTKAPIMKP